MSASRIALTDLVWIDFACPINLAKLTACFIAKKDAELGGYPLIPLPSLSVRLSHSRLMYQGQNLHYFLMYKEINNHHNGMLIYSGKNMFFFLNVIFWMAIITMG